MAPLRMALQGALQNACYTSAVAAVFGYEAVVYNIVYVCILLPAAGEERRHQDAPWHAAFNACFGIAMWCYWRARRADPGKVPRVWHDFVSSAGDALAMAPSRLEWQPGKATYCGPCGEIRPERSHHCRQCGICILRMDHHCPWLNNCVGFGNHKYFMLSLAYGALACTVGLLSSCPVLIASFKLLVHLKEGSPIKGPGVIPVAAVYAFVVWGVLALVLLVLLSIMLAAHGEMLAKNATSIEGYFSNMPNPFDQGRSLENVAQVFGSFGLDWFLPVAPWHPRTDGVSFERSTQNAAKGLDATGECDAGAGDGRQSSHRLWRLRYRVPVANRGALGGGGLLSWLAPLAAGSCERLPCAEDLALGRGAGPRRSAPTTSIIAL